MEKVLAIARGLGDIHRQVVAEGMEGLSSEKHQHSQETSQGLEEARKA